MDKRCVLLSAPLLSCADRVHRAGVRLLSRSASADAGHRLHGQVGVEVAACDLWQRRVRADACRTSTATRPRADCVRPGSTCRWSGSRATVTRTTLNRLSARVQTRYSRCEGGHRACQVVLWLAGASQSHPFAGGRQARVAGARGGAADQVRGTGSSAFRDAVGASSDSCVVAHDELRGAAQRRSERLAGRSSPCAAKAYLWRTRA